MQSNIIKSPLYYHYTLFQNVSAIKRSSSGRIINTFYERESEKFTDLL